MADSHFDHRDIAALRKELEDLRGRLGHLEESIARLEVGAQPVPPVTEPTAGASEPIEAQLAEAEVVAPHPPQPISAPRPEPRAPVQPAAARRTALDWETLVGTKGLTWAGSFVLVIALGFFVEWAWSTFETPPWLQSLGLHALGVGLLIGSWVLNRRQLVISSQGLASLGIFTLYATAFAALRLHELWSPQVAFAEMSLITVVAILIALRMNSMPVILVGALGGYWAPILVGGDGDHVALFVYLAFLNVALMGCAVWQNWRALKPLSLAATMLMFLIWTDGGWGFGEEHTWSTQWLLVLHGAIFLLATTLPAWLWKRESRAADLLTLTVNAIWFLSVTWALFHNSPDEQLALVSWALGLGHLVLWGITRARIGDVDRMPRVQLALATVFFTLAIPLQADDFVYLGVVWSVEGLIFSAIGIWYRDRQMCLSGVAVMVVAAMRFLTHDFLLDPIMIEGTQVDQRFALVATGSLLGMMAGAMYWLLGATRDFPPLTGWTARVSGELQPFDGAVAFGEAIGGILLAAWNVMLLVCVTLQWDARTVLAIWTVHVAVVWTVSFLWGKVAARSYALTLAVIAVGGRALFEGDDIQWTYRLLGNDRFLTLAGVAALYFAFGWIYRQAAGGGRLALAPFERHVDQLLGVLGNLVLLGALSLEVHDWFAQPSATRTMQFEDLRMARLATYSILWATYAAALVAAGFALRYPLFRLLGLGGLALVLLKVFFVDLSELELMPRVLAFTVLGILLLVVSVLYQRFTQRDAHT